MTAELAGAVIAAVVALFGLAGWLMRVSSKAGELEQRIAQLEAGHAHMDKRFDEFMKELRETREVMVQLRTILEGRIAR